MSLKFSAGDLTIHRIVEQQAPFFPALDMFPGLTPDQLADNRAWMKQAGALDDNDTLILCFQSYIVRTPHHTVLIDSCIGNDKPRPGRPNWNMKTDDTYMRALKAAGFSVGDIDYVMCTHLHVDHVGWNTRLVDGKWVPTFAQARYLFGRTEYEHWRDHSADPAHAAVFDDSVKPVMDAGRAELIASDARLTDEISLIPTAGHSPGHVSIHIRSDGEEALLTGDVAHHPCQMAHLDWSSTADSDPRQSVVARRELFSRFADTPALVIGGHYDAGYIKRDGEAFRFVAQE